MVDPAGWRGRCVLAYLDEPPYFMPVPGSDPTGCDIELANMVLGALDAAASTAPGNSAYVAQLGNAPLTSVVDSRAHERGGLALGAFSFDHESREFADSFDAQLRRTLGTREHLAMMARYGFSELALRPVIESRPADWIVEC